MILVTVGSMLPFDRLVRAMDDWCAMQDSPKVFAQIGDGTYEPTRMQWARALPPAEFLAKVRSAELVIAHAGMGSIITALEAGTPIVVMPRRVAAREVTTEHQVHTVGWLAGKAGIFVAEDEQRLASAIDLALSCRKEGIERLRPHAPDMFLERIRSFLGE